MVQLVMVPKAFYLQILATVHESCNAAGMEEDDTLEMVRGTLHMLQVSLSNLSLVPFRLVGFPGLPFLFFFAVPLVV